MLLIFGGDTYTVLQFFRQRPRLDLEFDVSKDCKDCSDLIKTRMGGCVITASALALPLDLLYCSRNRSLSHSLSLFGMRSIIAATNFKIADELIF